MKVKCFGIAREFIGSSELEVDGLYSVAELRTWLKDNYIEMHKLSTYMVAVNEEYANDDQQLEKGDVLAIIPPVSGG
jgi:molybdopterin converting factor subunit 1